MRGSNYGVKVSQKEEASDERIDRLWCRLREFLLHERPRGFAEPPNPKGNFIDGRLEPV